MSNPFAQAKDLFKLQKEARNMQKKMKAIKITAESKDGKVKLFMNGAQEFEDLFIDDSLLDPSMMELIKKGFREAMKDYQKKLQKEMMKDFDLDSLKGMLGN